MCDTELRIGGYREAPVIITHRVHRFQRLCIAGWVVFGVVVILWCAKPGLCNRFDSQRDLIGYSVLMLTTLAAIAAFACFVISLRILGNDDSAVRYFLGNTSCYPHQKSGRIWVNLSEYSVMISSVVALIHIIIIWVVIWSPKSSSPDV